MTRVIVVGAGVIGCTTAVELALGGAEVVLMERHCDYFRGTSCAGFGSLTPYSDPVFRGEARDFAEEGTDLYRTKWRPLVETHVDGSVNLVDDGLLELCDTEEDLHKTLLSYSDLVESGVAREVSVEEIAAMEPEIDQGVITGGLWLNEPWLDLDQYYPALRQTIQASDNIKTMFSTLVHELQAEPGHVSVITESGSREAADIVVLCTGVTEYQIEGINPFPLRWVRGDAVAVYTLDDRPLLRRHLYMHEAFITPRSDGKMLLGSTYTEEDGIPVEHFRRNRDRIALSTARHLIDVNARIVPSIMNCELGEVWRGWRPGTSDNLPFFGPLGDPRIIIATGFLGLGVTMAPASAKRIADYVLTGVQNFPESFSPERTPVERQHTESSAGVT